MAVGDSSSAEDIDQFRATVALILKDDGFNLPSKPARNALSLAERYLEWSHDKLNEQVCLKFVGELRGSLNRLFPPQGSMQNRREKMWENYYRFCSSAAFGQMWNDHLSPVCAAHENASPIFYQFVTDGLMEQFIKHQFPVVAGEPRAQAPLVHHRKLLHCAESAP